jgi:hypothetical protein
MYTAPFRIRHRPVNDVEPDWGETLTQEIVLQPGGPLYAQGPGDITRWMAVPWQADTAFCRSGYDPEYDPYLPTFWPARVPNQVLTSAAYAIVMNERLPREERIAAYQEREHWLRWLKGSAPEEMMQMIAEFGSMGIIEARPGIENDPDFPSIMLVESLPHDRARLSATMAAEPAKRKGLFEQAGWESAERLAEFRRIRVRR